MVLALPMNRGQLTRFLLNEARDAIEIFTPLSARHFAPDLVVRAPRRFHGLVDINRAGAGNLSEHLFCRRVPERFESRKLTCLPAPGADFKVSMELSRT